MSWIYDTTWYRGSLVLPVLPSYWKAIWYVCSHNSRALAINATVLHSIAWFEGSTHHAMKPLSTNKKRLSVLLARFPAQISPLGRFNFNSYQRFFLSWADEFAHAGWYGWKWQLQWCVDFGKLPWLPGVIHHPQPRLLGFISPLLCHNHLGSSSLSRVFYEQPAQFSHIRQQRQQPFSSLLYLLSHFNQFGSNIRNISLSKSVISI